ncbi:MAG: 2-amino-4-hydroxy-6-hydroxymethyldihydropteridine diphosphokinase [Pseudomonadota bacterium]
MILVGFGSNLSFSDSCPQEVIRLAARKLQQITEITAFSKIYRSEAWPEPSDPLFYNAVAAVTWAGPPVELLETLHGIEEAFGRVRHARNAPRTLDLDLLAFNDVVCGAPDSSNMVLPHPRIETRKFVLFPLRDVAPDWRHPVTGATIDDMLGDLDGDDPVVVTGTHEGLETEQSTTD